MDIWTPSIVGFVVETIVSSIIVYVVTKLFGEHCELCPTTYSYRTGVKII